jgi:hypothetical protein
MLNCRVFPIARMGSPLLSDLIAPWMGPEYYNPRDGSFITIAGRWFRKLPVVYRGNERVYLEDILNDAFGAELS